ncbi:hypothetical protein CXB51_024586 [Gossypium anomalum]|uniref:RNase H type-1 domain-containing protein n=1 Tax=Gossypium anomalum TaxID=47600 RepID=A0A8J6CML4_9ROSI|nr:hypothetical protein CXB51_024586 [Gossypium anomalum]
MQLAHKIFCSRVLSRLLTNVERSRRGIGHSSECPLGGHYSKDILHALRDCPMAKEAWMLIVPTERRSSWAQHFEPFLLVTKPIATNPEFRHHFSDNWVNLFSDGAITRGSGNAAAGGVIRDRSGNWILGFTHSLGRCSPLEAKLWGILDGILILLSKGYKIVRIQTDNFEVVKELAMEVSMDSGITVLKRVKRLLRSEGQWEIKYVTRECNLIADHLAKFSLSWKSPLQPFEVPPDLVVSAIEQDKAFRSS